MKNRIIYNGYFEPSDIDGDFGCRLDDILYHVQRKFRDDTICLDEVHIDVDFCNQGFNVLVVR